MQSPGMDLFPALPFPRLQQYAGAGDILFGNEDSDDDSDVDEGDMIFNRVNELIAKWTDNPSKQIFMSDLMKIRDIFIIVSLD